MPRARLTITIPEEVWIGNLSRAHPEATFRILAAMPKEGGGVGLVRVVAADPGSVVGDVESYGAVTAVELLHAAGNGALLQFETTTPLLLFPVQSSGVPLSLPFDIEDGEAVWEITTSSDGLSRLGDQLDAFGIEFRVDAVEHYVEPDRLLTERQRRVLLAAVERGYYDTPRECTLTELAEGIGIAKSTCSETLHRAEGRIVEEFVRDLEEPFGDDR